MWMMIREGGWPALVAALLGVLGVLLGLVAIAVLPLSRKGGHVLGVITLLVALAVPSLGALGMVMGQRTVDQVIATDVGGRGTRDRIRSEGYREAQSAAKVGLTFGLAPLLLGAVAALLGARRQEDERSSALRWAFAGSATALALLATAGAGVASARPIPAGPGVVEATLLDARDKIDTDAVQGCQDLERAVESDCWRPTSRGEWPRYFNPDPRKTIPDYDVVATRCARDRFELIKKGPTTETYARLLDSPLLVDATLKSEISEAAKPPPPPLNTADPLLLGLLGGDGGAPTPGLGISKPFGKNPPSSHVLSGSSTVTGRLPPEVIRRVVNRHTGEIKYCYENELRTNPSLSGRVSFSS